MLPSSAWRISASSGSGLRLQQVRRRHDHARACRTRTAARASPRTPSGAGGGSPSVPMPSIVVTELPSACDGEHRAALHGPPVDMDRARAALAGVAADVRAGQVQVLPQDLDQEPPGLDIHLPALAIHLERDVLLGHRDDLLSPVGRGWRRGSGAGPADRVLRPWRCGGCSSVDRSGCGARGESRMVAPWRSGRNRVAVGGPRCGAGAGAAGGERRAAVRFAARVEQRDLRGSRGEHSSGYGGWP